MKLTATIRNDVLNTMIVFDSNIDDTKTIKRRYIRGIISHLEAFTMLYSLVSVNSVHSVYMLSLTQFDSIVKRYLGIEK